MSPSSPSGPSAEPTRVKAGRRPRQQLTARQNQALQHLAAGQSIRQTAEALGLDRRTVQRWLNEDPRFRAAYNAWQQEQIDSSRAQLLTLLGDAAATVGESLKQKKDARTAMALLKQFRVMPPPPAAPSDPDLLRHATAIDHEEQRQELDRRAKALHRDDLSPIENEERRNMLENPSREYIAYLRDFCDLLEQDLDRREGKPVKPRPSSYVPPVRDPQTGELIYDSPPHAQASPEAQSPPAPQPDPQTHAPQSTPPASPAPSPRRSPRATDEPEPLDPTGPVVAYNDPNTFFLEEP